MNFTAADIVAIGAALAAILMAGSRHLRLNLWLYSLQTILISAETAFVARHTGESHLYLVALAIAGLKAIGVPWFLSWIMQRIKVESDSGTMLPAPMAMHLSVLLLGVSYPLTTGLPVPPGHGETGAGATAALSLIFTGILLMLTRRVALSQIIGFLSMENGIYLFALTQTRGMPMIVEMGILLDVLVGVMIAGLLLFRIQKSFEHIDVTQLTGLKD